MLRFTACDSSCASCFPDNPKCMSCPPGTALHHGKCITQCPNQYYLDNHNRCRGRPSLQLLCITYLSRLSHLLVLELLTRALSLQSAEWATSVCLVAMEIDFLLLLMFLLIISNQKVCFEACFHLHVKRQYKQFSTSDMRRKIMTHLYRSCSPPPQPATAPAARVGAPRCPSAPSVQLDSCSTRASVWRPVGRGCTRRTTPATVRTLFKTIHTDL